MYSRLFDYWYLGYFQAKLNYIDIWNHFLYTQYPQCPVKSYQLKTCTILLFFVYIKKFVKVRDDFILFTTYSSNLVSVSKIYIQSQ